MACVSIPDRNNSEHPRFEDFRIRDRNMVADDGSGEAILGKA
jgi:hypothetical protein